MAPTTARSYDQHTTLIRSFMLAPAGPAVAVCVGFLFTCVSDPTECHLPLTDRRKRQKMSVASIASLAGIAIVSALFLRIFYNLYLHPLAKFHGPWYAASFSLCPAIISVLRIEPQWMLSLTKKFGSKPPASFALTKPLTDYSTFKLTSQFASRRPCCCFRNLQPSRTSTGIRNATPKPLCTGLARWGRHIYSPPSMAMNTSP